MKRFVKFVSLITMVVMAFSSVAFAAEDVVTIEEYERALAAEYAKYGVEFKVLDYDDDITLTRDTLNNQLAKVEQVANSFKIIEVTDDINSSLATQNISPLAMYYDKDVYKDWTVSNAYGSATMRSEANVTMNGSNNEVISINSYETYQHGTFVNFDDWQTTSMTVKKNSTKGYIDMTIKGRVTFSYADPYTGIKTGYTSNVSKTLTAVKCF